MVVLQQLQLAGTGDGLGAAGHIQFGENVAAVLLHRVQRNHQPIGDLLIGVTLADQSKDL